MTGLPPEMATLAQALATHEPARFEIAGFRPSAVLMPFVLHGGEPHVVLTKRAETLPTHRGQIAFPGGKIDESDPSALHSALREAWEEIGLDAGCVRVLGEADGLFTPSGFTIRPFVGLVEGAFAPRINAHEIEQAFEVPWAFLRDTANCRTQEWTSGTPARHRVYFYDWQGFNIWGATAHIIRNVLFIAYGIPMT